MAANEGDPHWVKQQKKTFRAWVDSQLSNVGLKTPQDVDFPAVFEDGLLLIPLVEVVTQDKAMRGCKKPRLRIQKINNCDVALKLLDKHGFHGQASPENFVDQASNARKASSSSSSSKSKDGGSSALVLGFIWQLFVMWVGGAGAGGGKGGSDDLLAWVQARVKDNDRYGVPIENFDSHWQDGKVVCALLDSLSPKIVDYTAAPLDDGVAAWTSALDAAEDWLDVPQLLDPEDMVDEKPDDKSVRMQVELIRQAYLANQDAVDSGSMFPDATPAPAPAVDAADGDAAPAPPPAAPRRKDPRADISREQLIDTLVDMYSHINNDCLVCPECSHDLTEWAEEHNARVPELPETE